MTIRPLIVALGLAGAALVPVSASAHESKAGGAAEKLADPSTQMAAAAALAAAAQTILDMDIAPFTRALDAAGGGSITRDLPRDAKLRDLAGPEAERMPRQIARNVPRAMGSASEMAGALDEMMPQLKATARKLRDAIPNY